MKKGILTLLIACAILMLSGCAEDDALYVYSRAGEYLQSEDYATAASEYQRLIDYGYYVAESYRGIGLCRLREGNYPDACLAFERALINLTTQDKAFMKDVQLYLARARVLRGESEKALEIYDALLAEAEEAEIYYLRGKIYMDIGRESQAKADFDRATALGGDHALYIDIYRLYESVGKTADGSRYLEEALRLASGEGGSAYERAVVDYHLRDYENAKEELLTALLADPEDEKAVFLLGRVYLAMGNLAEARAMFKEQLDDEKNFAAARNGLALCAMEEGKYQEALEELQAGLSDPDSEARESLLWNQIIVYEYLHEWETACSLAKSFVGRYPENAEALREYEFLKTRAVQ